MDNFILHLKDGILSLKSWVINMYYTKIRRPQYRNTLKFAVITDPHYLYDPEDDPEHEDATQGSRLFWKSGGKLDHFVERINSMSDDLKCVIGLGDMIDSYNSENDTSGFFDRWDNIQIPKEMTIGNHDVAGIDDISDLESGFGYESRDKNAGSRFNQSLSIDNDFISAKIILVDTTINHEGEHNARIYGYMSESVRGWVESEIDNSNADIFFVGLHHGPHDYTLNGSDYFDEDDAKAYESMVQNRDERIITLHGHNHYKQNRIAHDNLDIIGRIAPATVERNPSYFMIVEITPNGKVIYNNSLVKY